MKTRTCALLFACTFVLFAACSEDPTAPPRGTIKVDVFTTGGDLDLDGYEILVGADKRVIVASSTVRFEGVEAGQRTIEVRGVASNCTVVGDNPRAVVVPPSGEISAIIEVACDATGIELEFRTAGADTPLPGYGVRTAGRAFNASPNGSLTISGLAPGSHEVALTIPASCSLAGESSFAVTVTHRKLTRVTVEVTCTRNSNLIAFALDTIINRTFQRLVAVTSATESDLLMTLFPGFDPAWSRDGKKLAYSTTYCDYYYGYGCSGGLSIIDYGTGAHAAPQNYRNGIEPAWSPDGRTIAFIDLDAHFIGRVKVAGADGPGVVLPLDIFNARRPTWSPDGNRIAFQCQVAQIPYNIDVCLVNRDGSGFLRLTADTAYQGSPAWSPDGSRLAFVNSQPSGTSIALMKPDGTGVTQLVPGWDPSWSPDGSKLVFVRSNGVFVAGADGTSVTRISTGTHHAPSWRP
jgi:dipeptidyl aminopeptidase/acylaminoacyl peptidase